jgi:8-oxo-dGTP pyrophosphatase MutT (NUDIX family)|tara:strand:+ start:57 stop:497 length:441 start_codon:yes stop_codon:yes gene_type:complete
MPCPSGPEKGIKQIIMKNLLNIRVYGLLMRAGKVLTAEENVGQKKIIKFPGGGVEANETPENALIREFQEEGQINISLLRLIHVPGTLFSPWINRVYTPLYYQVNSSEDPLVPRGENIQLRFIKPIEFLNSDRVALPECEALKRIL